MPLPYRTQPSVDGPPGLCYQRRPGSPLDASYSGASAIVGLVLDRLQQTVLLFTSGSFQEAALSEAAITPQQPVRRAR